MVQQAALLWVLQAGGARDWGLPESHVLQVEGDRELYVGGVHVHVFLKEPNFPLRNPKVSLLPPGCPTPYPMPSFCTW